MAGRLAVLALTAMLLAGCGEKHEPAAARAKAVAGTIGLAKPAPGSPDAGTRTGHRAPGAIGATKRTSLAFSGHVRPPSSRVTLRPARGGPAAVAVARDGSFRARARALKRGQNRFVLEGRAPRLAPWKVDISITRR